MNNLSLAPKIDTPNFLENIASNKYFIGIIMIVMNIGARFLIDELTPEQKKMVNTQNFRRFIIFCAFFAATRDLLSAITLTIIFILFISEIFTDEEDIGLQYPNKHNFKTQKGSLSQNYQLHKTHKCPICWLYQLKIKIHRHYKV